MRIDLFGGLRVEHGESASVTRFRSQKIGALLAFLALNPHRSHAREELADRFWPDADPEAARTNLRTALSTLRRQIEPAGIVAPGSILVTRGHFDIALNTDAVRIDVAEFDHALQSAARPEIPPEEKARLWEQAVALFRGPLLPGFTETWVLGERERRAEAFSQTLAQLAEHYERTGDIDAAVRTLRRAVDADPRSDDARERLARLQKPRARPRTEAGSPATPVSAPAPLHLPLTMTRFFGREAELRALTDRLCDDQTRLVTLTGPGGSGKTRLAIETARRIATAFSGGVWFVPLADLREPDRVPDAIAEALRLTRAPRVAALDQAAAHLADVARPALLVLDNLEHLIDADAAGSVNATLRTLLARAPRLTCLVTSRQRLLLDGEAEIDLAPLPTPSPERVGSPERLLEFSSVQLFVNRSQVARPDFQLTTRNTGAVAALCAKLEGVPLAIELAAAWAQALTPQQILERLDHRFDLLVARRRGAPGRHATLRAAIEWSWGLLPTDLQAFFARLSVFRGGWSLEAAEAVAEAPSRALEHLTELRERSLLIAEPVEEDASMRFRMLETLREFADEKLTDAERAVAESGHAAFFLERARAAESHFDGPDQKLWLDRMEIDHDNVRAAFDHLTRPNAPDTAAAHLETALRLVVPVWRFWIVRGHLSEGRRRIAGLLERAGDSAPAALRAAVLRAAGSLAGQQGDMTGANTHLEACLPLFRAAGDAFSEAAVLCNLAQVRKSRGEYGVAKEMLDAALALFRAIPDARGIGQALLTLGSLYSEQSDLNGARDRYEQALTLFEQLGDRRSVALTLQNLGVANARLGDAPRAEELYRRSLEIRRELRDQAGLAATLETLGTMASKRGDYETTARCYEESLAIQRQLGNETGIVLIRLNQAKIAIETGDLTAAEDFLSEALTLLRGDDASRRYAAYGFEVAATLAGRFVRFERAAALWGAAAALRETIGAPLTPIEEREYAVDIDAARSALGETAFDAAWQTGSALERDAAFALALGKNGAERKNG